MRWRTLSLRIRLNGLLMETPGQVISRVLTEQQNKSTMNDSDFICLIEAYFCLIKLILKTHYKLWESSQSSIKIIQWKCFSTRSTSTEYLAKMRPLSLHKIHRKVLIQPSPHSDKLSRPKSFWKNRNYKKNLHKWPKMCWTTASIWV
jgi:hypothetical protein